MRLIANNSVALVADARAPILDLISLKKQDMNEAVKAADALGEWLGGGDAFEPTEELQKEGAELALNLWKVAKKRRAFESLGKERAAAMAYAADYTDEWYRLPGNSGSFRTFYLCGRKWGEERCHTLTVSSLWNRLHQDPIATKQRWYCPVCQAKYKTTNVVMVELMCNGETSYVKAPFPPDDIADLKAMAVD